MTNVMNKFFFYVFISTYQESIHDARSTKCKILKVRRLGYPVLGASVSMASAGYGTGLQIADPLI